MPFCEIWHFHAHASLYFLAFMLHKTTKRDLSCSLWVCKCLNVWLVSRIFVNENYQLLSDTACPWFSCVVFQHAYEFWGKMALWSFPNPQTGWGLLSLWYGLAFRLLQLLSGFSLLQNYYWESIRSVLQDCWEAAKPGYQLHKLLAELASLPSCAAPGAGWWSASKYSHAF